MYSSIEGRSPMLDFRLVELMLSIPSIVKGEPGEKNLFRKLLKGHLPNAIIDEKKVVLRYLYHFG